MLKLQKFILSTILLCLFAGVIPVNAQTNTTSELNVIKKSDLNLDIASVVDSSNFASPTSILLTPIFLTGSPQLQSRDWYRGLFYYFVSERYNFKDIPAHFVISKKGEIYEGIKGGVEKQITLADGNNKSLVIMYLADSQDTDFDLDVRSTLQSLLLKLANENSINPDNINLSALSLQIAPAEKTANLAQKQLFGSWQLTFKKLIEGIKTNYKPIPKQYQVALSGYENPTASVKAGTEVTLGLKLKNTGEHSIFASDDSELFLATADGRDSQLFLNNEWVSKSQFPVLKNDAVLSPGAEVTSEFKVKVPLTTGQINESFILKNGFGQQFRDTRLQVTLNIDREGIQILEIASTETGTLNVRQNPSANAQVVGKASPNERYVWLERNDTGWYKIRYGGNEGWVLGKYVKVI